MRNVFKVGESVLYKPGFGTFAPEVGKIVSMELTDKPCMKEGTPITEATIDQVNENRVLFILDNKSWIYSEQIVHVDYIAPDYS